MELKMDKILSEKTRSSIYGFIEKGHPLEKIISAYENANKNNPDFNDTWSVLKEFIEFSYDWFTKNETWEDSYQTFKNLYENDVFSGVADERVLTESDLRKQHEDKIKNISHLLMKKNDQLQSEYERMISEIDSRNKSLKENQQNDFKQIDEAIAEEKISDDEELVNGFVSQPDSNEEQEELTQIIDPSQFLDQTSDFKQVDEAIAEEKISDDEELVNGFVSQPDSNEEQEQIDEIQENETESEIEVFEQQNDEYVNNKELDSFKQVDEAIAEEKISDDEELVNGFVSQPDSNEEQEQIDEIQENEKEEEIEIFEQETNNNDLLTVTNFFEGDETINEETLDFESKKEIFPSSSFEDDGLESILSDDSTIVCQSTVESDDEETLIDEISAQLAQEEIWEDMEESINDNNTHVIDEDVISGQTTEVSDLEEITKTFNLNNDVQEEGSTLDAFAFLKGLEDKYEPTEAMDLDFFDEDGNEVELSSLNDNDVDDITLGEEVELGNRAFTVIGLIENDNEPTKVKIEDCETGEIKIVEVSELDF